MKRSAFIKWMSGIRITVEWIFKEMRLYWTILDVKRELRIGESPVAAFYISGILLCDIRNCIYPNRLSQYFGCLPPRLEDFLTSKSLCYGLRMFQNESIRLCFASVRSMLVVYCLTVQVIPRAAVGHGIISKQRTSKYPSLLKTMVAPEGGPALAHRPTERIIILILSIIYFVISNIYKTL